MTEKKHFTLFQLNQSIKKLLGTIEKQFWISAEIADVRGSDHLYLELVHKEEDRILAKARANIWLQTLAVMRRRLGKDLDHLLQKGAKVLILVEVTFHEVYGLSLNICDLDPAYTLGELEMRRRQTIEKLAKLHLFDRQKKLHLPAVIQRIALLSSSDAAGYGDFMNQLHHNPQGYRFYTQLFHSAVQGERAETEIPLQLRQVDPAQFDAIVLIRGGGSRLDLEAFNHFDIAEAIATAPLPVLTGIGHLRDETVSDLVAHLSLKTPTAVAEFLLQRAAQFEQQCTETFLRILQSADSRLQKENARLNEVKHVLQYKANQRLRREELILSRMSLQLDMGIKHRIGTEKNRLAHLEKSIDLLRPENVLKRGYSLTLYEGKTITAETEIKEGGKLITQTKDVIIQSAVISYQSSVSSQQSS